MNKFTSRTLIIISLTLNLLVVIGSIAIINKKGGLPWLRLKVAGVFSPKQAQLAPIDYYKINMDYFEGLPIGPNDIIFFGDSILSPAEWHELMDDGCAKNRSISGDDTSTILNRINPIIIGRPRHVVFGCGINNLQRGISYEQTTREYAQIVDMISSQLPNTDLWLLQLLPVNEKLYQQKHAPYNPELKMPSRREVETLNDFIKILVVDRQRVYFVDMPALLNHTGELREDCTYDGLHLNGRGLEVIAARLQQLGLTDSETPISCMNRMSKKPHGAF